MRNHTRTSLRAAAGLAGVLLLSACSGSDEPSEPAASSEASASETSEPETSEPETSEPAPDAPAEGEVVAGADLGQRMLDAMTAAQTASFTAETSGSAATTTEGVIRIEGDSTSTRAVTQAQGQSIEIIVLPEGAFANLGPAATDPARPWLLITPDSADPVAAAIGQFLDSFKASSDPRSSVEVYRQAGDFTLVGTEDVDGVEATRYSGAIPPQALLSTFPEEMRAGLEPLLGTEPFPVEVWLDAEDRPVRFVQTATIQGAETTSTQGFTAWGEPVEITAPPADQVQGG